MALLEAVWKGTLYVLGITMAIMAVLLAVIVIKALIEYLQGRKW